MKIRTLVDRQEYDVREERRRELEFLEKVWHLELVHCCFRSLYDNKLYLFYQHHLR